MFRHLCLKTSLTRLRKQQSAHGVCSEGNHIDPCLSNKTTHLNKYETPQKVTSRQVTRFQMLKDVCMLAAAACRQCVHSVLDEAARLDVLAAMEKLASYAI